MEISFITQSCIRPDIVDEDDPSLNSGQRCLYWVCTNDIPEKSLNTLHPSLVLSKYSHLCLTMSEFFPDERNIGGNKI